MRPDSLRALAPANYCVTVEGGIVWTGEDAAEVELIATCCGRSKDRSYQQTLGSQDESTRLWHLKARELSQIMSS